MGIIYSEASEVLIWLESANPTIGDTLTFIPK